MCRPGSDVNPIWLDRYPPNIPAQIQLGEGATLPAILDRAAERFADRVAYESLGVGLRQAELAHLSRALARFLREGLGLEAGDRVALVLPNLLSFPVALHAILRAGLVAVPLNPLYTARELEQQLRDSGARAIFILDHLAGTFASVADSLAVEQVILVGAGDLLGWPRRPLVNRAARRAGPRSSVAWSHRPWRFAEALAAGRRLVADAASLEPDRPSPDDLACLQYTGGTTGTSKAAMLSHRNLAANTEQVRLWLDGQLVPGREVAIGALPMYHVFALMVCGLLFPCIGARTRLVANPRDMRAFVKLLRKPFTVLIGVNTLFDALLDAPGFEALDLSALKLTVGGGTAVQRATAERWQARTGRPIIEAYGLTEASPAVCVNPLDACGFSGAVGLPLPSTELAVRDELGQDLPPGEPGEICVRGPQVMRGYWQRPEETRQVLDARGWLRTGDIGSVDALGFVQLHDRKKDLILVSGFKVYPNEVESVACSHPAVREAAAIGVPHPHSGEAVMLFVVRRDPALEAEELQAFLRERLTAYKCPRQIAFRDSLPKNAVGKVLRRALREPAA
ncbi:MAG: AMP-binding protein [Caldilineae bacterium]|nr:AMP-binding protein [Caldilineae bacterium]